MDGSGRVRLSYPEILAITAAIPEVQVTIKKKGIRQRLRELLDVSCWTDDASLTQVPDHLRPYQRNGLAWLESVAQTGNRRTSCR